jgi:hypothetical protein
LRALRIGKRRVQFRAEHLEIHRRPEGLELVTEIAQPPQSVIDIEKSRLPSHQIISDPSVTMESETSRIGKVLRTVHEGQRHGTERFPAPYTEDCHDIRSVIETARRRAITALEAIRVSLAGKASRHRAVAGR